MKLKSYLSFKPKLSKSNIFSVLVIKCDNKRCFRLKRPRFIVFKRRRFRARFKNRLSVKALRFPKWSTKRRPRLKFKRPRRKNRFSRKNPVPDADRFGEKVSELVSVFRSSRRSQELDRVMDMKNLDLGDEGKDFQPSDLSSPVCADVDDELVREGDVDDGLEEGDVCVRFESHVAEMIVKEGKLKDLCDVEEVLYCWKSLKSQVFVDLVCGFYGEMCKDLFCEEE